MFMLTDDGGEMQVEENYLKLMEKHYRKVSDDEESFEDYKKFAEKYKSVIEEYS